MGIDPGVRLVAEVGGTFIGHLPQSAATLCPDDQVVYGPMGGSTVTYKVERVQYVAEYSNAPVDPSTVDRYSVYGRTDLIVSVVP